MKLLSKVSCIIALVLGVFTEASAQHPTPIDMLYQPLDDFFRFSGAGGGSLYGLFKPSGAASGILSLDGNFNLSEKMPMQKEKLIHYRSILKFTLLLIP
jgi:hypothetical protein